MEPPSLVGVAVILLHLDELDNIENALLLQYRPQHIEWSLVPDICFDTYTDANALEDFRFTCSKLRQMAGVINIPNVFITDAGDRFLGFEALAMLCYRLSYPGKLSRIRKQFGRSDPACCRIITDMYCFLDKEWNDTLFFHDLLYAARHHLYTQAVSNKTNGVVDKISMFIDGTKDFICRSGKRKRRLLAIQSVLDDIPIGDAEIL
ncbi:hypothetical protein PHMEG_00021393 [Phytophthora megakarya]|uniref:Uncharacterized protein n=1 Tax=Phytophthora megakarya TaxID=4795 RepID=A0A225VMM6_9STRA|nr:hypothetical protein PHMEG_00021393 [Phytophthora megakarya]